jgi:hypothetical protein
MRPLAFGAAQLSLVPLIVGLLAFVGAAGFVAAVVPSMPRLLRWRRRRRASHAANGRPAVVPQRRVVTGPSRSIDPTLVMSPNRHPERLAASPVRRSVPIDTVLRAESLIDHYLATDPETLAAVLSSWLAADDRNEARNRRR